MGLKYGKFDMFEKAEVSWPPSLPSHVMYSTVQYSPLYDAQAKSTVMSLVHFTEGSLLSIFSSHIVVFLFVLSRPPHQLMS